jgi:hypothetical protein
MLSGGVWENEKNREDRHHFVLRTVKKIWPDDGSDSSSQSASREQRFKQISTAD